MALKTEEDHRQRNVRKPLGAGNAKERDFSLEPSERHSSTDTLILAHSMLLNYKSAICVVLDMKFVVICCSSHRQGIQTS